MSKYIDADKVKEYILSTGFYCDTEADRKYSAELIDELFPIADVAEVRHGRWIEASAHDPCDYRCSECGWLSDDEYHYCPNCGAKMDIICSFLSDEEVKQPCIEGPCGFECKKMDEVEE